MSRSEQQDLKNPAKVFLQWNGQEGGFTYFDKNKGEKGEKVRVELPIEFMVLDTLATIRGYNDKEQSGFWSNEVRDTQKDVLVVRTKKGVAAKGLYSEIIGNKACSGAKFCQSVYVVMNFGGEMVIANIQMMGAALSSWIDFVKANKIYQGAVCVKGMKEGKKGVTKYQIPVFEIKEVSKEDNEKAKEMDRQLQVYLLSYFKMKQEEIVELESTDKQPQ